MSKFKPDLLSTSNPINLFQIYLIKIPIVKLMQTAKIKGFYPLMGLKARETLMKTMLKYAALLLTAGAFNAYAGNVDDQKYEQCMMECGDDQDCKDQCKE